ncbi:MAG: (Fe-S)-binding protein, partial [Gammaproteobacteria bacterium]
TFWLHGHCHQKAFDALSPVNKVLESLPGAKVRNIASSCCGMAGSFGYQQETQSASVEMAELSLLPTLRQTGQNDCVVADGFSCRHQIRDLSDKKPQHVVRVLAEALD